MKVNNAISDFLAYLRVEKNYSDKTVRNYGISLHRLVDYLYLNNKNLDLSNLKLKDISAFRQHLYSSGISGATAYLYAISIRSFIKWALHRGYTQLSYDLIELPRVQQSMWRFLWIFW